MPVILIYVGLAAGLLFFIAVPTWFICSGTCYKTKERDKQLLLVL